MNPRPATTGRLAWGMACQFALFACLPAFADNPAPPKKITTINGITEYRLDNGLQVLLLPDQSTANVTLMLTVMVGSRHEGYGETGMAHLLEHMQFKGTPTFPKIPKVLQEHGAQFNANTWLDRTMYFEIMPASDANLEFGLRLEADRLLHSNISAKDLKSEMTVVRNEFEMGENNPQMILSQRMLAAAYEWHNYGKTTIGSLRDIERVPIPRLQAFYHKYYQPDNALLVVSGKFKEARALASIVKTFGPVPRPTRKLETTYTEEPPQDGEHSVTLRRVGKVGTVGVVYHIPAAADEDYPAVSILNGILTNKPSGRLYKALVEGKKATNVSGSAYPLHDPGIIQITAQVDRKAKPQDVRDALIHLVEGAEQHQFTREEVARARLKFLKDRDLLMNDSDNVAMELGEWQAKGDWRLFFIERQRVAKLTPEDVTRVADKYLVRSNRTSGVFLPTEKPQYVDIAATPSIADIVKDYKGEEAITRGQALDPRPANLEKHVKRSRLPVGIKTALLPKKTRGQAVVAQLTLRFGNEQSLTSHTTAAELLATLMTRGTKKHSRQQIHDELDRLGARLEGSSEAGSLTFMLQGKRQSLPGALRLLGEILREPTFPQEEFDILHRERRDALRNQLTEPQPLALNALRRRLNPYPADDIRYVPTIKESIERLQATTLEDVRKLYTEQLGAQVGELAVVGDFDPEETTKRVADRLDGWKAAVPYKRIARPARTDVDGARQEILTPDKKNAFYIAGELLALADTDPDYPALKMGNFVLGGGVLSSRLANRVRQQEGLSYGVASIFAADSRDRRGQLIMYAICNPAKIGQVDKAIREELARLLKDGVDDTELAEAKRGYLEQEKVQRASDDNLVGTLAEQVFDGRTFAYAAQLDDKIQALTPDQVAAALRKHIAPKRLVVIRAGDFKKTKAEK
ncbi:MAG TPA: pitrilysin family protein [Gemmataceae bacterium]|jgi:zinc protease|nr:pitrilysin family protein [Gemmataceae bacterium]